MQTHSDYKCFHLKLKNANIQTLFLISLDEYIHPIKTYVTSQLNSKKLHFTEIYIKKIMAKGIKI